MPPAPGPAEDRAPLPLDPSAYPRTYRMRSGWRIFLVLLGTAAIAGGGAGVWYFGTGHEVRGPRDQLVLVSVGIAFLALGLYLVLDTIASRVTLTVDAIEIHDLLPPRRIRRDEVAGRRVLRTQYTNVLVLEPRRRDRRRIKLPLILDLDVAFVAWLDAIPDLDALEEARSGAEVLAAREPGRTEEEQLARIARARRLARWGTVVATAAALWGWFLPRPYPLAMAILAVLPWGAVLAAARSRGVIALDERRNEARPNLAIPLFLPGAVLLLRALLDVQLLEGGTALAATVIASTVLTAAALAADAGLRRRPWMILVLFVLLGGWGYGAPVEANVLLDRSQPEVFETTVLAKHVQRGKGWTTYELELGPWGPRRQPEGAAVPRKIYDAVEPGDAVRVRVKPGALGMPWLTVVPRG
jgi:uncharacterized membrane protein YsdA (DUF1294 family)